MFKKLCFLFLFSLLILNPLFSASHHDEDEEDDTMRTSRPITDEEDMESEESAKEKSEGVRFQCKKEKLQKIEKSMEHLFDLYSIDPTMIDKTGSPEKGFLEYTLDTPDDDTNTLNLYNLATALSRNLTLVRAIEFSWPSPLIFMGIQE